MFDNLRNSGIRYRLRNTPARLAELIVCAAVLTHFAPHRAQPQPPTAVFVGVEYQCVAIRNAEQTASLAHIIRIDLNAPGIELYINEFDTIDSANEHQYLTGYVWWRRWQHDLAVAINGPLFSSDFLWLPAPGCRAQSLDTVVVDSQASHVHPHSYLLGFSADLTPFVQKTKPPTQQSLQRSRWAVGAQGIAVSNGRISPHCSEVIDQQAMLGVDSAEKLLWIAAFERASQADAAKLLAGCGAKDAVFLDSGSSTNLCLAESTHFVSSGNLVGCYRPVAVTFGIRAKALTDGSKPQQ